MQPASYPGGLSELDFVGAYHQSALRKPQVVADAALRALVLAGSADRLILCGLIAEQLAESCRRLAAVHGALWDRRYAIARSLLAPLPGLAEWQRFARLAATLTPEQMLRDLSLDESAMESARRLRAQPDLANLGDLVAAAESGSAMLLIPGLESSRPPSESWFSGIDRGGEAVAAAIGVDESDAAALADLTAELSSIARGFLGAYLHSRRTAGRPA
jgi:hypothetical protein